MATARTLLPTCHGCCVGWLRRAGERSSSLSAAALRKLSFSYVLLSVSGGALAAHRAAGPSRQFHALPPDLLSRLVVVSDLWKHYPASVYKARLPVTLLPTRRAKCLAGESRMNFVGLVTHGLSAISVFGDRVGVRLLVATAAAMVVLVLGLLAVLALRFGTGMALPGWATTAAGFLLVMLTNMLTLACAFTFTILSSHDGANFLPMHGYHNFVAERREVYQSHEYLRLCG